LTIGNSAERTFNKLTRTFISQMEALKRYRTGGEQTVTVQHVNVSESGQAIVGRRPVIICSEPDAEAAILVREREYDLGWVAEPESPLRLHRP
jgi:hypothetical protein